VAQASQRGSTQPTTLTSPRPIGVEAAAGRQVGVQRRLAVRATGQIGPHRADRRFRVCRSTASSSHRLCQIRARCSSDRRSTTGSHGNTDRQSPTKVPSRHRRLGTISTAWRVKDSNLGRHQPTDLQSVPHERRRPRAGPGSGTEAATCPRRWATSRSRLARRVSKPSPGVDTGVILRRHPRLRRSPGERRARGGRAGARRSRRPVRSACPGNLNNGCTPPGARSRALAGPSFALSSPSFSPACRCSTLLTCG
jgi:hypothetical protein